MSLTTELFKNQVFRDLHKYMEDWYYDKFNETPKIVTPQWILQNFH